MWRKPYILFGAGPTEKCSASPEYFASGPPDTKLAEYSQDSNSFLLLASTDRKASALNHRFLDQGNPPPIHRPWRS